MKTITCDQFSKILNVAVASSKLKEVSTPYKNIRPFIHVLIWGEIGTGKSTILFDIGKNKNVIPIKGLTSAHYLGAVDQTTGIFITPSIWDSRESVLLIDEFFLSKNDYRGRESLNTMLMLLENPVINKKVGYRCNDFEEKQNDLFCIVKNSNIKCSTRFSLIMTTMMNLEHTKMNELKALKSRCICIPFFLSYEELREIAKGKKQYIPKEIKIKKDRVKISKKKYEEILSFLDEKKVLANRYLRLVGDLCRVYAVLGKIDEDVFNIIIEFAQ